MRDLYSGAVDEESIAQIIRDEDNLKSIAMAETIRGNGEEVRKWLAKQERPEPELTRRRTDVDNLAQRAVIELLECLESSGNNAKTEGLRERLREAHAVNRCHFQAVFNKHTEELAQIMRSNRPVRSATVTSIGIAREPEYRTSALGDDYDGTSHEIPQKDKGDFYLTYLQPGPIRG